MASAETDASPHLLTAGFARTKITPPLGGPLAGYSARPPASEGVHDELFARALALSDGYRSIAIVSVDLLAVDSTLVNQVRSEISRATGIAPEAIMIAATHTHGGPVTTLAYPPEQQIIDPDYIDILREEIVGAVAAAWNSRFPAQVGTGTAHAVGIGGNRHRLDGATDPELGMLKIADLSGQTRAVCLNYACHATILGPNNLHITADFPGFAVDKVSAYLSAGKSGAHESAVDGFAMFLNGASGNISVGRSPQATALGITGTGRTFERAAEIGHQLADLAIEALPGITTTRNCTLDFAMRDISLELRALPSAQEARAAVRQAEELLYERKNASAAEEELLQAQLDLLYANLTAFEVSRRAPGQQQESVEIQCLRIGGTALIAMPLEPFTEIGLELKSAAELQLFLVGTANGYLGYLPFSDATEEHAYETISAHFTAGSDRAVVVQALELEHLVAVPGNSWRNT